MFVGEYFILGYFIGWGLGILAFIALALLISILTDAGEPVAIGILVGTFWFFGITMNGLVSEKTENSRLLPAHNVMRSDFQIVVEHEEVSVSTDEIRFTIEPDSNLCIKQSVWFNHFGYNNEEPVNEVHKCDSF